MLTLGLGIGVLLLLVGVITYFLAPRIGPNPIFGVRVGYSYASREVWDQTNRCGGALIALTGIGVAVLALLLQSLSVAPRDGIAILIAAMIAALLGETAWMFVYSRGLAQGTALAREIAAVRFRWAYLAPTLVTFALLVALAAYFYPQLPADRVATHFNLSEQPDGWQTRDEFYAMFLGLAALFVVLDALIVFVATREPLIAFGRWGSTLRLEPERGLIYAGVGFALVNVIFAIALWDIGWFNSRGGHAFPLSILLWMIVPLIAISIALFFVLGRREV
jgi:uncharacterized membrane protein